MRIARKNLLYNYSIIFIIKRSVLSKLLNYKNSGIKRLKGFCFFELKILVFIQKKSCMIFNTKCKGANFMDIQIPSYIYFFN